jgi:hypothetical protein
MTGDLGDQGATVNEWVGVVRRAKLSSTVKLVALTIASYADPDGSHVFPGIARVAVQCDLSYRAAQYAVATLRKTGLIKLVSHGNRRRGLSDEYRLILAADLLERCDVPTPAAERAAIERVTGQNQAKQEKSRIRRTGMRLEPVDNRAARDKSEAVYTHPGASENGFRRKGASTSDAPGCVPPSIDLSIEKQPPSDEAALRTPRTGRGIAS